MLFHINGPGRLTQAEDPCIFLPFSSPLLLSNVRRPRLAFPLFLGQARPSPPPFWALNALLKVALGNYNPSLLPCNVLHYTRAESGSGSGGRMVGVVV